MKYSHNIKVATAALSGPFRVFTLSFVILISLSLFATSAAAQKPHKRYYKQTKNTDEYSWVTGNPGDSVQSYPAPSGEEDRELLPETWGYVITNIGYKECYGDSRDRTINAQGGGAWWFSQVVGQDHTSGGTHMADMENLRADSSLLDNYNQPDENPNPGQRGLSRLYSPAFDIVLVNTSITDNIGGPISSFGPYITNLRNAGIVCWHRWVAEDTYKASDMRENEMHCIDPASPYIKLSLQSQIANGQFSFMDGLYGGKHYLPDFGYNPDGTPGPLWATWIKAVRNRQKAASTLLSNHPSLIAVSGATALPSL